MNHGTATLKVNIINDTGEIIREVGEVGIITAFLPDDNKYAVMFEGEMGANNWFTFHDKETFEEYFDYELNEEDQMKKKKLFFKIYVRDVYKGTVLEQLRYDFLNLLLDKEIINKVEEVEFKLAK